MTVDSSVQALIDAALAPVKADVADIGFSATDLTARMAGTELDVANLIRRVTALEGAPAPVPTPPPPPPVPTPGGVPAIPAGYGSKLLKNFSDGKLAPFYATAYPDDHVSPGQAPGQMQSGQYMTQWCRYTKALTDPNLISVHDGYLDLGCVKRPDGSGFYDASFVTTGMPSPKAIFANALFRWMARFPGASGKADWRTLWLLIGDSWGAPEPDWPEIIGGKMTANVHGPSASSGVTPFAIPSGWHEWGTDLRTPGKIIFTLDGQVKGTANVTMNAKMALLADSKVGLATPDATTPSDLRLHIAWATVD